MANGTPDMEALKYEIEEEESRTGSRIKVIGIGGGGCNTVSRLAEQGLAGVEFFAMDTDSQALAGCRAANKLQLGVKVTKGLGVGSDVELGRQAALENTDAIVDLLQGCDMVFVCAGLGGGTGTGAAPVVASLAKELDALTIAMVTRPFQFEGPKRMKLAEEGLKSLAACVDAVITVPNDRLLQIAPRGASVSAAFQLADDVVRQAVEGISDIINSTGIINLDFSDIKAAMAGMGHAMLGTAVAKGENAASEAARQAINCPLLEDTQIAGARRILINVTGSSRLGFHEVNDACALVREAAASDDAQLSFGVILDERMQDSVKVTVIATGVHPEPPSVPERRTATPVVRVADPEPAPAPQPEPPAVEPLFAEADPEPEFIEEDAEEALDIDDLDTPAYLRQGRSVN